MVGIPRGNFVLGWIDFRLFLFHPVVDRATLFINDIVQALLVIVTLVLSRLGSSLKAHIQLSSPIQDSQ